MPCNTLTTQSVALANAIPDLMLAALVADGYSIATNAATHIIATKGSTTVTWTAKKGLEITGRNTTQVVDALTQQYSKQAVTWAASRAGWSVTETASDRLTVTRR
jgi:hypothetical protein